MPDQEPVSPVRTLFFNFITHKALKWLFLLLLFNFCCSHASFPYNDFLKVFYCFIHMAFTAACLLPPQLFLLVFINPPSTPPVGSESLYQKWSSLPHVLAFLCYYMSDAGYSIKIQHDKRKKQQNKMFYFFFFFFLPLSSSHSIITSL